MKGRSHYETLSPEQKKKIQALIRTGEYTNVQLAARFNVSQWLVSSLARADRSNGE